MHFSRSNPTFQIVNTAIKTQYYIFRSRNFCLHLFCMKYPFLLAVALVFISAQTFAQAELRVRCEADSSLAPFYHGVASGEPAADGIILWTRITTDTVAEPEVQWRVATDTLFDAIVASGTTVTSMDSDFCVHVSVNGLMSGSTYYYQFTYNGKHSLTGRTKTLPAGDIDSLRFAVISCASLNAGYFNVYDIITKRNDFDAVIFLGDYIYEYESDGYGYNAAVDRPYDPEEEIIDLSDYRTRHSQYKLDEQLRVLHQNFPFICAWDDHEFADNAYNDGAVNHQPLTEGDWHERVAAAEEAYFDWMPVRKSTDPLDPDKTYRAFQFGDLMQLSMLDTRIDDRDEQLSYFDFDWDDTARHIISIKQRNWLFDNLRASTAQWQVIGQQVMLSPLLALGIPINDDQWDGYPKDQEAVLQFLRDSIADNKIVLTGDIHSSWANDIATPIYDDTGAGSAGVEFVGPSVTSPSMDLGWAEDAIQLMNAHIKYIDITHRGFLMLDVNKSRTQGDYYFLNNINTPDTTYVYDNGWQCLDGNNFLIHAPEASVRPLFEKIPLAPACPMAPDTITIGTNEAPIVVFGLYPNPVEDLLTIQYALYDPSKLQIEISDLTGRIVLNKESDASAGWQLEKISLANLPAGEYLIVFRVNQSVVTRKLVHVTQ